MIDLTISKKQKRPKLVQKKKQQGRHSIPLHVRFKDELKNSDRNSQNERGIVVIPLVLITINSTCLCVGTVFGSYLMMGHELGSATDINRLLVSSALSTPIFTLLGKDDFWSCHTHL